MKLMLTLILSLLLSLLAGSASAQVKHLVLDLDSTLVQGIPSSKSSTVKKNTVIQISDDRKYTYVIRPHTTEIIKMLGAQDGVILHIASDLPQSRTDKILNAIKIHGSPLKQVILDGLGKILYSSPVELSEITTDTDNVVFITSKPTASSNPSKQTLFMGQYQYYFDDYQAASAEIASLTAAGYIQSHDQYLPKNQQEFQNEYDKLAKVLISVLTSKNANNFASAVDTAFKNPSTLANAQTVAANGYTPVLYSIDNGRCSLKDLITGSASAKNIYECVKNLNLPLEWRGNRCSYIDADGSQVLTLEALDCIKKLAVDYYWKGPGKNRCYAFAENEPKVWVAGSNCSALHAIHDRAKNFYHYVPEFPGMENLSEAEIVREHLGYDPVFSLAYYDPSGQKMAGVSFPRNAQYLWRAMDPVQFDVDDAIKAMLGDASSNVESKAFTHLKLQLMGKTSPFNVPMAGHIQTEMKKISDQIPLPEERATTLAKKLIDEHLLAMGAASAKGYFLDKWSTSYVDWNPWGVFSSVAPAICLIYGKSVLISYKESKVRTSDLNYYNYVNNSAWVGGYGSGAHADTAEFITPSHIEQEDITGFFTVDTSSKNAKLALLKGTYKGAHYIAGVVNSGDKNCLVMAETENSVRECDYTKDYTQVTNSEAPVGPSAVRVPADFVIRLCPANTQCSVDQELLDELGVDGQSAPNNALLNVIKGLNIYGNKAKVFTKAKSLGPKEFITN